MPLGTPQGPTQSRWTVTANSVALVGDYPVSFDVVATTDNPDADGVPEIVQTFVDLIDQSPDFKLASATRSYGYTEQLTPSS
ncbi:hypothetical protein [Streptomyces sp. NPDC051014]|uniref:hypothetical protein n=1 Tax=Streptomyces sp. NPDC051014 TaxID=3155751 RepID=UPI0033DA3A08